MRTYTLTLIALLMAGAVNAQPTDTRTPAQVARDKEHKAYQDAYMDGIRKTDYRPTFNSGKVDNQAAQQLADLFAKRAGRKTSAEKAAEEKAGMDRYYADLNAKKQAFEKQLRVDIQAIKIREPMKQAYMQAGLEDIEAEHYVYEEVTTNNGYVSIMPQQRFYEAKGTLAKLKSIEKTAPFEEVMELVLDIQETPAPVTSLAALQRLAQRFPDKIAVINQAIGRSFKVYFIDWGNKYTNDPEIYGIPTAGSRAYMLNSYEAWFNYDIIAALAAFAGTNAERHPISILTQFAEFKKDHAKVSRLSRTMLLSPNPDNKSTSMGNNYRDFAYARIHYISKFNYTSKTVNRYYTAPDKVHTPYTTDEVRRIAQAQGVKPVEVLRAITGSQAYHDTGGFSKAQKKAWKLDDLLEQLAKEGDPDAKALLAK